MLKLKKIREGESAATRSAGPDPGGGLRRRGAARGWTDEAVLARVLGAGRPEATGVARQLLAAWRDPAGLARQHPAALWRTPGLGATRLVRLLAALELGRRALGPAAERSLTVRRPEDLHPLLRREFAGLDRERFLALYLDTRHRVVAMETVSVGSLNASLVHPREVFRSAVTMGAAAVIVAHNHPSGCSRPSGDDLDLTARLDRCGDLLGIALLDHLVVGADAVTSIREHGWPHAAAAANGS
jgi:DNA repair protein RadC